MMTCPAAIRRPATGALARCPTLPLSWLLRHAQANTRFPHASLSGMLMCHQIMRSAATTAFPDRNRPGWTTWTCRGTRTHGSVRSGPVRDCFADVVRAQPGTGAGLAAWCDGRLAVDLWVLGSPLESWTGGSSSLLGQIDRHVLRNPGDWSAEDLFERLGAFEGPVFLANPAVLARRSLGLRGHLPPTRSIRTHRPLFLSALDQCEQVFQPSNHAEA